MSKRIGWVVEIDIKSFYDTLDHEWMLRMVEQRVSDRAFLNLIGKWLRAGIMEEDGKVVHPATGTPQGGIVSCVLANIYLHYALDLWFEKQFKATCKGDAFCIAMQMIR
jgi:retron-type reverse transcriptase